MTVTDFTSSKSGNIGGLYGTGGTDAFTVGGTLHLLSGQQKGLYAGSFTVTVNYN